MTNDLNCSLSRHRIGLASEQAKGHFSWRQRAHSPSSPQTWATRHSARSRTVHSSQSIGNACRRNSSKRKLISIRVMEADISIRLDGWNKNSEWIKIKGVENNNQINLGEKKEKKRQKKKENKSKKVNMKQWTRSDTKQFAWCLAHKIHHWFVLFCVSQRFLCWCVFSSEHFLFPRLIQ